MRAEALVYLCDGHGDYIATAREKCPLLEEDRKQLAEGQSDAHDPNVWSGRALQEVSSIRQVRSCINVSGLCLERVVLRAIMDISAHAVSLADRPRPGHSGHQCSHAPGRPISIIVSSSRRPRRAN